MRFYEVIGDEIVFVEAESHRQAVEKMMKTAHSGLQVILERDGQTPDCKVITVQNGWTYLVFQDRPVCHGRHTMIVH